jgi:hypothetical protein
MKLGETYRLKVDAAHLWVVITTPDVGGSVVIVNLTSYAVGCDATCLVNVGEHPFVVRQTVVGYKWARVADPAMQAKFKSQADSYDPVSMSLLKRIQQGALTSDLTPQKVQKLVAAYP